jgi:hypothetical protein
MLKISESFQTDPTDVSPLPATSRIILSLAKHVFLTASTALMPVAVSHAQPEAIWSMVPASRAVPNAPTSQKSPGLASHVPTTASLAARVSASPALPMISAPW